MSFVLVVFMFILSIITIVFSLIGLLKTTDKDVTSIYSGLIGLILGNWAMFMGMSLRNKYQLSASAGGGNTLPRSGSNESEYPVLTRTHTHTEEVDTGIKLPTPRDVGMDVDV